MIHHAPPVAIIGIMICYILFAFQVWHQAPRKAWKSKGGRAVFALVTVFVLCAAAGYATTLLSDDWKVSRDMLHWLLLGASVWLVTSNQAGAVAAMITRDD